MDLNIVKNRNAERGVVKFKFYAKRSEFVETGKEELVEETEQG
jgi:replicative DNA helicase